MFRAISISRSEETTSSTKNVCRHQPLGLLNTTPLYIYIYIYIYILVELVSLYVLSDIYDTYLHNINTGYHVLCFTRLVYAGISRYRLYREYYYYIYMVLPKYFRNTTYNIVLIFICNLYTLQKYTINVLLLCSIIIYIYIYILYPT